MRAMGDAATLSSARFRRRSYGRCAAQKTCAERLAAGGMLFAKKSVLARCAPPRTLAISSFVRCVPSHDEAASQDTDRSAMRRVSPADARHATPQLSWDARVCRMQLGAVARCSAIMRWRIARGCDCIAGGGEASGDASASCDECDLG